MDRSEREIIEGLRENLKWTEQALLDSQRECNLKDQQIRALEEQLAVRRVAKQRTPSASDEQQKPSVSCVENEAAANRDLDSKTAKRAVPCAAVKGQYSTPPVTVHSVTRMAEAPSEMRRGAATMSGNKCYFMSWGSYHVHEYDVDKNAWVSLSLPYPYRGCALVVINGLLTGVGGIDRKLEPTNQLCALVEDAWSKERYPEMPTPRAEPAVVRGHSGDFVVVIGGRREVPLATVEVMDIASLHWTQATPTPVPLKNLSATLCGEHIYVTEGVGSLAFKCKWPHAAGGSWEKVADLLMRESTASTLCGHPVVVSKKSCDIYAFAADDDRWHVIGQLSSARSYPFLVQVGWNKVLIVGGGDMEKVGGGGSSVTELLTGNVVI